MIGMVAGNLLTTGSMNGKICLPGAKLFFKKRLGNFEATAETRANLVGHKNSFTTGLICQNQIMHARPMHAWALLAGGYDRRLTLYTDGLRHSMIGSMQDDG